MQEINSFQTCKNECMYMETKDLLIFMEILTDTG